MNTERPGEAHPADDAVDQAWRAASSEEPPTRVDAAILAAARAQAGRVQHGAAAPADRAAPAGKTRLPERGRRDSWRRWQPLAAAAAVAGLAFVLAQMIPRDRDVAPPVTLESARPDAGSAPPIESSQPTVAAEAKAEAEQAVGAPPAVEPVMESAPSAARDTATTGIAAEADSAAAADYGVAPPPPAAPAAPARAEARSTTTLAANDWAARIQALYEVGDLEAAATELRAFRAAHGAVAADRHLPDSLQQWAATVR